MALATYADWRAQVDKELAGASFDKLVAITAEGLAIQPLYVEGPAAAVRGGDGTFGVCVRCGERERDAEFAAGADAVWTDWRHRETQTRGSARQLSEHIQHRDGELWLGDDPISIATRQGKPVDLTEMMRRLGGDGSPPSARIRGVAVSALDAHDAGADAADELALMLSTMVAYLRANPRIAHSMWFQIAVGRDTFGEIAKLRALRVLAAKIFAAGGIAAELPPIHAVCSARTQSQRDPWVNMLRVTTEVFAAALGGARYVTPAPFDAALGEPSAHARRVARNTALVLRDESFLGRVADAAGGSYYIESRTDALAREAWARFQQLERDGGILKLAGTGKLAERLAASWAQRAATIAKRKEPILGVSEFANPSEQLPSAPPLAQHAGHRDAEGFEALRARVEASAPRVALIALGPPAESRARVGFATALFATVGIRATEGPAGADIACICGSDERYAAEAGAKAGELRAAGVRKIVLAGRPGADGAIDAFIYLGCDVLATMSELLA